MNSRYNMIDAMFSHWLSEIEDTELLREWHKRIDERVKQVEKEREFTTAELVVGLRSAKRGDVLYAERRVRLDGDLYPFVYFYHYQPRKQRLWVSNCKSPTRGQLRSLTLDAVHFHQLARTELATRRRAPMSRLPSTAVKAVNLERKRQIPLTPSKDFDPDDIPF